jgi:hypothetical protein
MARVVVVSVNTVVDTVVDTVLSSILMFGTMIQIIQTRAGEVISSAQGRDKISMDIAEKIARIIRISEVVSRTTTPPGRA